MKEKSNTGRCLTLSVMLGSFAFGIMSFVLPVYTKKIGGSAVAVSGLFSVFSVATAILRPFIGKGIDRFGRKFFLVTAFFLYAAAMLLFSFSTSITLIYISRLVQAVGSSFMWITAYTIMVDISEEASRGKSVGQLDAASSKGALYGAVIGFSILLFFPFVLGWSILFKGYAVLSFISGLIVLKFMPETGIQGGEAARETQAMHFLKNRNFIKLLCILFISSCSSSMLSPLLMIYLQDQFTKDVRMLALAFTPAALVYAFLPSTLGRVSDKIGRIKPMMLGFLGSAVISLGFVFCNQIALLILLWVLEAVGVVMASPAEESLVADITHDSQRGSAYGFYLFISSIGATIGPLLGGVLYDTVGHTVPFYLNSFLLLFDAALVYILLRNYKRKE